MQGACIADTAVTSDATPVGVKQEPLDDDVWTQEQWMEYYYHADEWEWYENEGWEGEHPKEEACEPEPEETERAAQEPEWEYVEDSESESWHPPQPAAPIKAKQRPPAEPAKAKQKDGLGVSWTPLPPPPAVRPPPVGARVLPPPPPPPHAVHRGDRHRVPEPPRPCPAGAAVPPWKRSSSPEGSGRSHRSTSSESRAHPGSASSSHQGAGRYVGGGHGFVLPNGQFSASLVHASCAFCPLRFLMSPMGWVLQYCHVCTDQLTHSMRPGGGRKRPRNRGGYAEKMKQNLNRLQAERDADHAALRTAAQMSGHLVLGGGSAPSRPSGGGGGDYTAEAAVPAEKGKGKGKWKKGGSTKGGKGKDSR